MTLLGHLIPRMTRPEPAATQALGYILTHARNDVSDTFFTLLRDADMSFQRGEIEIERAQEGRDERGRPDLTIYDKEHNPRVFVENKFWAALTDDQPVGYLHMLPRSLPTALLFIVPETRVAGVWNVLKERCRNGGFSLSHEYTGTVQLVRIDSRALLITSWKKVLGVLRDAAAASGDTETLGDIHQFQGLTERMDSEAFLPLSPEDLTDVHLPQRLINYNDLVEPIVAKLTTAGIATPKGSSSGLHYFGRNLFLNERFEVWFGVHFEAWRDSGGITPLWLQLPTSVATLFETITVREEAPYSPIHLETGVERESVIDHAFRQITQFAETLRGSSTATSRRE